MIKKYYFTPYRYPVPGDYESWFEKLGEKGWHPVKISHFCSMVMKMQKGEPKKYKYVVDLQARKTKEYVCIYEDLGWEYLGRMSSVFVFRKEYSDVKPESFTDKESLINRNKRFIFAINAALWMMIISVIILLITFGLEYVGLIKSTQLDKVGDRIFPSIFISFLALFLYLTVRKVKKNTDRM